MDRRRFFQSLGVVAGATAVVPAVVASSPVAATVERSMQSVDKMIAALENVQWSVWTKSKKYGNPHWVHTLGVRKAIVYESKEKIKEYKNILDDLKQDLFVSTGICNDYISKFSDEQTKQFEKIVYHINDEVLHLQDEANEVLAVVDKYNNAVGKRDSKELINIQQNLVQHYGPKTVVHVHTLKPITTKEYIANKDTGPYKDDVKQYVEKLRKKS